MDEQRQEEKPEELAPERTEVKRSGPGWKPGLVLGLLLAALAVLVIIFFTGGEREKVRRLAQVAVPKAAPAPAAESTARRTVTLFFLSDNDDLLHGETREIAAGPSAADEAERALAELIKGSAGGLVSPLPAEARVRQVFITKEGVAYVDFGREIMEKSSYGSSSELAAVFSVVDTLAYNFKSVKKVAILVEGAEKETLGGHIDLTQPFPPDYSIVAR
ncbi:MAG TPA: GerMN domain-containing protein [Burkholderiales bacterium]|nr:GerMN domain-containing protein [Burkholderiales bacterium]